MQLVPVDEQIDNSIIEEIREIYWESDEYVANIAGMFGIGERLVVKLAGAMKYTCVKCGVDCIQEHRMSREIRYYDCCKECIYEESTIAKTDELEEQILAVKDFLEHKNEIIKNIGRDEYFKTLKYITYDYSRIETSLNKTIYRLSKIEGIKNTKIKGYKN